MNHLTDNSPQLSTPTGDEPELSGARDRMFVGMDMTTEYTGQFDYTRSMTVEDLLNAYRLVKEVYSQERK